MTITALPDPPSRSDPPATFITKADAFLAALPTLATEVDAATLAMNLNATTDTSASSVAIGTGAKTFTVTAGKSFLGGMFLVIADDAAPSTNYMVGQVTSYSGTSLVMNILSVGGSGTKSAWTISQSAVGIAGGGWLAPLSLNVPIINGYVDWTIAANALTASIKTYAGADPSPTDPVYVTFRDPTLTNGAYYVRPITAALSITASAGSKLGTASAIYSRIRAVLMDDAGTVVLGLYNALKTTNSPPTVFELQRLNEGNLYTSVAEGGAGAADNAHTIYTDAVKTSKPIRQVGYCDIQEATAGTWATAPLVEAQITCTTPQVGDVIQTYRHNDGAVATGTTVLPYDDTIPQDAEGIQFMASGTFQPVGIATLIEINHEGNYASSGTNASIYAAIFESGVADALAASQNARVGSAGTACRVKVSALVQTNGDTSKTFNVRCGASAAGTTTFNGTAGGRIFGGVMDSFIEVKEIMT